MIVDETAGHRPQAQAQKQRHVEESHDESFPPPGGNIPHVSLDHRHDHGRGHALEKADNDQLKHMREQDERHGDQKIAEQAGDDKWLASPAIRPPAEKRQQNAPGNGEGPEDQPDVKSAGTHAAGIDRQQGHHDAYPGDGGQQREEECAENLFI